MSARESADFLRQAADRLHHLANLCSAEAGALGYADPDGPGFELTEDTVAIARMMLGDADAAFLYRVQVEMIGFDPHEISVRCRACGGFSTVNIGQGRSKSLPELANGHQCMAPLGKAA